METRAQSPLLPLDSVSAFLDEHGLGSGPVRAQRIGEGGGSNFTFLLERDDGRFVLRRPPRPPLPPSAHDMVREARLQLALAPQGIRLPTIRAVGDDESVLGVPFYVMDFLDGHVITDELPAGTDARRLGEDLVDTLVEIHAADVTTPELAAFARPGSYNERQVKRFAQLWEINKTRELPTVEEVGRWLADNTPDPLPPTVVHGDYRLGNMMVLRNDPSRIDGGARLGDGRDRRPACGRRLPARDVQRAGRRAEPARHVAGDGDTRLPVEGGARPALRRAQRP